MRMVNLAKVKDELSRHVDYVRQGGRVRILVRGKAVADLVPIGPDEGDDDGEVAELEREGVVRRGLRGPWPRGLDRPGPRVRGVSAVAVLLDERARGR